MATVTKPIALDESFNTTEVTPRNIADVLAEGLSHITGRTASEVEYDNSESELDADNVQDALDEIAESVPTLPTTDIQTAVDEFETYNGGLLSECKVALSPNQDLHGYLEPWVGGAGKNKAEQTVAKIKSLNTSGTWSGNAYTWNGIKYTILTDDANNVIGYDVDGTATARGWLFISDTDFGNDDVMYNGTTMNGYTFTSGNPNMDGGYYCFYSWSQKKSWILVDVGLTKSHDKWYPMVRLSSESDPTFEPYSNICPISGHTQVDVQNHQKNLIDWKVNATSSPWNGIFESGNYVISAESTLADGNWYFRFTDANGEYSYTKEECGLGSFTKASSGWVYGGSTYQAIPFTVPNGCTLIEIGKMNADGTIPAQVEEGSTATPYEPYNGYQLTVNLGGTYYSGTFDVVSGELTVDSAFIASYNGETLPSTWISDRDVYAVGTTPTTGAEVCYKLATPQSIQLSPTMVKALVGENHLSAPLEGQEITESKYKQMFTFDDVIAYIQSLS